MTMGAADLCEQFDSLDHDPGENETSPSHRQRQRMLRMAQEVFWEYQWQLREPLYAEQISNYKNELPQFHVFGYIALLVLDCRGNRLQRNGMTKEENSMISSKQWKIIDTLNDKEVSLNAVHP